MLLSELAEQWRRNSEAVKVNTPVLLYERTAGTGEMDPEVTMTEEFAVQTPEAMVDPQVFAVRKSPHTRNEFPLGVTLGRKETNDIMLAHPSVSRLHAWLQQDPRNHEWLLCDAGSKNGTFFEGEQVPWGERVQLKDNGIIVLGHAVLRFLLPPSFTTVLQTWVKPGGGR